ncbi:hypothetical protein FIBSPDRAFT_965166 [Athelia psychrophila]|uniref:Uncharacterized protein n=1 Tax=Athelia psychrophila TaxID=1759441 RepID=A0A165WY44_9AGAM|nr:hypothetical protein FIBSPDRAFT_965166 [Fibularhizoctonia sp. CBS 109695]
MPAEWGLRQYHPWNTPKTGDVILDELGADMVCFQARTFALPASYDAFFSFPTSKAEESLTGTVRPKIKPLWNALTECMSGVEAYFSPRDFGILAVEAEAEDEGIEGIVPFEAEPAVPDLDLVSIDAEGRTLLVDFGLFVLINTYCLVDSPSPARPAYKTAYHLLLLTRVCRLIAEGREVVLTNQEHTDK